MQNETKEIKKVSVGAVSIKKTKADGTQYMWNDKKTNTRKPRTMVSLKIDDVWYMGWSYKDGSVAESIKTGDVIELLLITEVAEDGKVWKSWKFPKPEDVTAAENEELKRKLAAFEAAQSSGPVAVPYVPNPSLAGNAIQVQVPGVLNPTDNPSASDEPPF